MSSSPEKNDDYIRAVIAEQISLKPEDIESYAQSIMNEPRIKGKAVILCEGTPEEYSRKVGKRGVYSPGFYRKLNTLPDSDFYTRCLPQHMRSRHQPQFFNCGSRAGVFRVFIKLHELHQQSPASYLTLEKLFVLVDLDIQHSIIEATSRNVASDTETVFHSLYQELKINQATLKETVIFTTGLIHKEAYFLLPELTELFSHYENKIFYKNEPLDLVQIYRDIINEFEKDKDLEANFTRAQKRLEFSALNIMDLSTLRTSFYEEIQKEVTTHLIQLLFLIRKAKPYWQLIHTEDVITPEQFRDRLSLSIAKFYSEKNDENFHLTAIFNAIYERANSL